MSSYIECRDNMPCYNSSNVVVPLASDGFIKVVDFAVREWGAGPADKFLYNEVVSMLVEVRYNNFHYGLFQKREKS